MIRSAFLTRRIHKLRIFLSKTHLLKPLSYSSSRYFCITRSRFTATTGDSKTNNFPFTQSEYLQSLHDTLEIISEKIDIMIDSGQLSSVIDNSDAEVDIELSDGVLTLNMGDVGTFVISRQTPSRQLWLSSPLSGPWHYTYDHIHKEWLCTKEGPKFFERMEEELSQVLNEQIKFKRLI